MNEVDNPTISPLCGIRTRTEWWDEKPKINNGMLASSLKGNKRSNRGSIRKAPECFKQDTWFDFQADLSFKGGGGEGGSTVQCRPLTQFSSLETIALKTDLGSECKECCYCETGLHLASVYTVLPRWRIIGGRGVHWLSEQHHLSVQFSITATIFATKLGKECNLELPLQESFNQGSFFSPQISQMGLTSRSPQTRRALRSTCCLIATNAKKSIRNTPSYNQVFGIRDWLRFKQRFVKIKYDFLFMHWSGNHEKLR